jgi:Excreted virulence factor EspC, type VII ESX diderm
VELDQLASGLASAGSQLRGITGRLESSALATYAFGGNGPGRLGELGRALAAQHDHAVESRRADGARLVDAVDDLADTVATAAVNYRDLEDRRTAR